MAAELIGGIQKGDQIVIPQQRVITRHMTRKDENAGVRETRLREGGTQCRAFFGNCHKECVSACAGQGRGHAPCAQAIAVCLHHRGRFRVGQAVKGVPIGDNRAQINMKLSRCHAPSVPFSSEPVKGQGGFCPKFQQIMARMRALVEPVRALLPWFDEIAKFGEAPLKA